jgi:hypothetical protein
MRVLGVPASTESPRADRGDSVLAGTPKTRMAVFSLSTEGFATPDLVEAAALLGALA